MDVLLVLPGGFPREWAGLKNQVRGRGGTVEEKILFSIPGGPKLATEKIPIETQFNRGGTTPGAFSSWCKKKNLVRGEKKPPRGGQKKNSAGTECAITGEKTKPLPPFPGHQPSFFGGGAGGKIKKIWFVFLKKIYPPGFEVSRGRGPTKKNPPGRGGGGGPVFSPGPPPGGPPKRFFPFFLGGANQRFFKPRGKR